MNETGLKPPFDEEYPDSERRLPEGIERAIEQGTLTPRMVGYHSDATAGEVTPPQSDGEPVDEITQSAEDFAAKHGGHPNDRDWRYQ